MDISGWRELAVLIAHFTSTSREIVGRYAMSEALCELEAIKNVMEWMRGTDERP